MSTLSRVIFNPDTTPPTIPISVVAAALSPSTIRVSWVASSDTGGAGLAGYRVYRSTTSGGTYAQIGTDLTTASLSFDDPELSAGQTRYYKVLAFDGNGNASAQSSAAFATTTAAASSGETVGSYGAMNLATASVYRINSASGDMPVWVVEGATHTYEPTGAWDGGPAHKITPLVPGGGPTGEGAAALGSFALDNNGSLAIRKLNIRYEVQFGSAYGVNLVNQVKHIIVHTRESFGGAQSGQRPMYYLANMGSEAGEAPAALQVDGLLALGVASGTVKNFEPVPPYTGYNWPRGREDFLWGPSTTTISGKPIYAATDWYTMELEMVANSTTAFPNGLIRGRVIARSGAVLTDLSIPWNWDGNWSPVNKWISDVQLIGGYGNATQAVNVNNFFRLAGITFAANFSGLIGPRAGFVTG